MEAGSDKVGYRSLESLSLEYKEAVLLLLACPPWVFIFLSPCLSPRCPFDPTCCLYQFILVLPPAIIQAVSFPSLLLSLSLFFFFLADLEHNRCDIPEESWVGRESEVAYASYIPGSIIWAKQYGYPW